LLYPCVVAWLYPSRAFRAVVAGGGSLVVATTAWAEPAGSARVQVAVSGCSEELAPARLSDALAVELRNLDPELVVYIENTNPRVTIACRPRGDTSTIVVHVTTERGEALKETLEATEVGAARFVAIAIAESLHAQASTPPEPPPPPPPEPAPEPEPEPARVPPPAPPAHLYPAWWGRVALGTRLFGDPGLPSVSGRLGVERASSPDWVVAADVESSYGDTHVDSGDLRAVTGSFAFSLHHRSAAGRFAVLPGLGARAGVLRWKGRPSDRSTTRGLSGYGVWAGPFADLRFALGVTSATRVDLDVEGGFNPMQVKATEDSNVVASIGELWLSLQIGVAFQP
jgi:hypothetical protein